jgi:hypothetical protein
VKELTKPLKFVVLLGIVSLLADVTYEGARSVTGPYLALLGASAAAVGAVAGAGELFGYALRLWSGHLADRTQRYWALTIIGYAVNLLAVPALAWADRSVAETKALSPRRPRRDNIEYRAIRRSSLSRWAKRALSTALPAVRVAACVAYESRVIRC